MKEETIFDTAGAIKEMVYGPTRKCEVLAQGTYKGIDYRVISYGTHPCSYIRVPENNKYFNVDYDDIPLECHCGLTFGTMFPNKDIQHTDAFSNGYWIGWDYAHYCDYTTYSSDYFNEGMKYTTTDLLNEVRYAIESFIEISK